jgi:hypothetical protein
VVSFTTRPLYAKGKSPRYPLDRRLGGPQSLSGRGGKVHNYKVRIHSIFTGPVKFSDDGRRVYSRLRSNLASNNPIQLEEGTWTLRH